MALLSYFVQLSYALKEASTGHGCVPADFLVWDVKLLLLLNLSLKHADAKLVTGKCVGVLVCMRAKK